MTPVRSAFRFVWRSRESKERPQARESIGQLLGSLRKHLLNPDTVRYMDDQLTQSG